MMYGYQKNAKAYQHSEVETADRGKLLLMVYDHCIKWCHKATTAIEQNDIEGRTKAIFKVQDGITELICSLDFEKGGEIANSLHRLYDFYNKHLTDANIKNSEKNITEVRVMLENLREGWVQAIQVVRTKNGMNLTSNQTSYVSLLG